jgi:hypothetical protein
MDAILTMLMLLWNLSIRNSERSTRKALALFKRVVGLTAQQRSIQDEMVFTDGFYWNDLRFCTN